MSYTVSRTIVERITPYKARRIPKHHIIQPVGYRVGRFFAAAAAYRYLQYCTVVPSIVDPASYCGMYIYHSTPYSTIRTISIYELHGTDSYGTVRITRIHTVVDHRAHKHVIGNRVLTISYHTYHIILPITIPYYGVEYSSSSHSIQYTIFAHVLWYYTIHPFPESLSLSLSLSPFLHDKQNHLVSYLGITNLGNRKPHCSPLTISI